ncbi:MAG TPA: hypothetical protein VK426_09975, partial [Methanobacterium sp.]|nr:hypothetical protein [Methanobacterium sp.]
AGTGYELPVKYSQSPTNSSEIGNYNSNLEITMPLAPNSTDKKSNAMKDAFNVVSLFLIIGLICSLLMPKKIHKPREHGVTTHI